MEAVGLTPREQDILRLLCEGYSDRAIAEQLVLSVGTVKWYNKQIFAKLGVNNRVQATLAARKLAPGSAIPAEPQQQLPLSITSFIGRTEVIEQACSLLADHRLITLVGPGGVGKTRLAVEIARRIQADGHFIPYFVPLATQAQPEATPLAIAEQLGIAIRDQTSVLQQIMKALSRQPVLLVLDNFEHLLPFAESLMAILHTVPDVRLLVTSRERLSVYGELVFPLAGLALPESDSGGQARNTEAVRLFLDRSKHADATFQPTDAQVAQITEICRLLQGMPLAIEHAASWTHILDPTAILTEIQHGLDILQSTVQGIEPRHQSMRAVIDLSWQHLSPREQSALMRLSVFRGGFRRDAATYVANADLELLTNLLAKSFVARSSTDRFDLHELHRQYAHEKLVESGENALARKQHAYFFEQLIRDIAPQRWNMEPSQLAALDRLEEEYSNLREAIQWSLIEGDSCLALNILGYGAIFFHDRGHGSESVSWTRTALARCVSADAAQYARAYFALALQDSRTTDEEHQAYLSWADRSEDLEMIAVAYWQCGDHAVFNEAYEEAQRFYEHALQLAAQTEYENLRSIILSYMGQLAELQNDLESATQYYLEAYEHMRAHGVRSATRPRNLGRMMLLKGDEARARELFGIAIDNAIYLDSPLWTYETLCVIAAYLQDKGNRFDAVRLFAACQSFASNLYLEAPELLKQVDSLREQVGATEFEGLWAAGSQLSLADATGLAQQALDDLA